LLGENDQLLELRPVGTPIRKTSTVGPTIVVFSMLLFALIVLGKK
jgi:hypothetical protein